MPPRELQASGAQHLRLSRMSLRGDRPGLADEQLRDLRLGAQPLGDDEPALEVGERVGRHAGEQVDPGHLVEQPRTGGRLFAVIDALHGRLQEFSRLVQARVRDQRSSQSRYG